MCGRSLRCAATETLIEGNSASRIAKRKEVTKMDASAYDEIQIHQLQQQTRAHEACMDGGADGRRSVVRTWPRQKMDDFGSLWCLRFHIFRSHARHIIRHVSRCTEYQTSTILNYIFVHLGLSCDPWETVNGARSLALLLASGDDPFPKSFSVIEDIQGKKSKGGAVNCASSLTNGACARISSGHILHFVRTLGHLDVADKARILPDLLVRCGCVALRSEPLLPVRSTH